MPATPYLTVDAFKLRADLIQPKDVDLLEQRFPLFVEQQILVHQSRINAQLKKRYAVPFGTPVPEIVLGWLTTLVTRSCWHRRGYNAADPAMVELKERCDQALGEIREAADAKDGLFDLPLNDATGGSAVVSPAPLAYTENSPYVSADNQEKQGRAEDEAVSLSGTTWPGP